MNKILTHRILVFALFILAGCGGSNDPDPLPEYPESPIQPTEPPANGITDEELLDAVQIQTLKYFWEFAEPNSGMARERNTSGKLVTAGGSGFGIMALIAGVERGFLSRTEVVTRINKICAFLENADRYHGVWPHWINGETGKVIPFSDNDDGADLVETSFLMQGLLTAKEYFNTTDAEEVKLRTRIQKMWEEIEWTWFTKGGEKVLYWHWSQDKGWAMNMKITGWNEALIVYVLAASSPTYSINADVYYNGWAQNGNIKNGAKFYEYTLPLGVNYGGPMFFAHYSFLGLDPRNLSDQYANYWEQNVAQSKIQWQYARNTGYKYPVWGLTASDDPDVGYQAHAPFDIWGKDNGTIAPTAAIASMPYLPDKSLTTMRYFYENMKNDLWGEYGFYDAFNLDKNWVSNSYIAIDQGPIMVMIENYRSGAIWNAFMKNKDIQKGLTKLGFTY